jgi:hypothetical protein
VCVRERRRKRGGRGGERGGCDREEVTEVEEREVVKEREEKKGWREVVEEGEWFNLSCYLYACQPYSTQTEYGHGRPGWHVTCLPHSTQSRTVRTRT